MYQVASNKPSPHVLITKLRKHHPAIYKELVSDFKPLKYSFDLIPKLYSATGDKLVFYGSILLLFGKYSDPLTMPRHHLHHGTGGYLVRVTGMQLPNVSISLSQAVVYFKIPGFREDVTQFIFDTVGITV